jgi:hypothetical protein
MRHQSDESQIALIWLGRADGGSLLTPPILPQTSPPPLALAELGVLQVALPVTIPLPPALPSAQAARAAAVLLVVGVERIGLV